MKSIDITRKFNSLRVALKHSALAVAMGTWLAGGTALAAPANDNFANAIDLTGVGANQTGNVTAGTQTGTNTTDATLEGGEPATVTYPPPTAPTTFINSVWFTWTCPVGEDGTLRVRTAGSTHTPAAPNPVSEWDAVLGINTGSPVNSLTPLGASPQDTGLEETLTVPVFAGITYRIQLAGFNSEEATNIFLDWTFVKTIYEAKILTFGPGAFIDEVVGNAAAIEWTYPYGTPRANLAPTFTLSPGATCNQTSGAVPTPTNFAAGTVTYTVNAGGPNPNPTPTVYTVTAVSEAASSECEITAFGPGAVITGTNIAWTVPNGTNLATLAPTYTMSAFAMGSPASGVAPNFATTNPQNYTITAQDGTSNTVYSVTVTPRPPFVGAPLPPVTSGMKVWLAGDNVNIDDPNQARVVGGVDTFVTQWNDASGNNNNATNATLDQQPKYIENVSELNGKPALRFAQVNDNSGSRLLLGDLSAQFPSVATDPFPTAVNRGSQGAINGAYVNLPARGVTGALVGDSNTATTFNSSSQYMSIPYSPALNPTGAFSAEIWVKPNGSNTSCVMSSGDFPTTIRKGWIIYAIGTNWDVRLFTGTGTTFSGFTTPLTLNAWQHLTLVHDGAGGFQLYVNGVAVTPAAALTNGTATGTTFTPNVGFSYAAAVSGYTAVGARFIGPAFGNFLNGTADEFAFYGSALSAGRVLAHYQNGMNAPTARIQPYNAEIDADSPLAHYKLDEAAGPAVGATVFAVTTLNNDLQYSLFGNRANDERWVGGNFSQVTPGAFRGSRADFSSTYAQMPHSGSHIFAYESSSSAYRFLLNGAQIGSTTGDYNAGAGVSWVIGSNAIANGAQLKGDIAELILFNRILSPLEAAQMGGYLEKKYGLPTAYPSVDLNVVLTSPGDTLSYPSGTTIQASATVSAGTISGGTAPYTVQFWVDGALKGISPSTANPYTFDLVSLTSASHEIYVKVIDSTLPTPMTHTSATHTFQVAPAIATTTTLVSSTNPSTYGAASLTATVVAFDSSLLSGGTVQFFNGANPLGSPVAVNTGSGEATTSINTLGVGSYSVTAVYSGNGVYTTSSTPSALAQVVNQAPLMVTASNIFRPTNTANLSPLPYKITGYQNGQTFGATSGVTGAPVLATTAVLASPVGAYPITCDLGSLAATNYSFTLASSSLTVGEVPDTFSVSFYANANLTTDEQKANIQVSPGMPAGSGSWLTNGWFNQNAPFGGGQQPIVALTSNRGSAATFNFKDCRNGWIYNGARGTLLGDGNGNMMDGHANGTLNQDAVDNPYKFDMEMTNIPFAVYDVIFYIGSNLAQFGSGTGVFQFNGGAERAFTLKPGEFDGTFTEMVDATTLGNYIVIRGVTGTSFTTKVWGTGNNGFNHIGPSGFQIRDATGFNLWSAANAGGQAANLDFNNDGVQNGVAYFMGATGVTTNPGLNASNAVTWPANPTFRGSYEVQTSPNLSTWTSVDPRPLPVNGNVTYTLPPGLGKQFMRLLVTPAP